MLVVLLTLVGAPIVLSPLFALAVLGLRDGDRADDPTVVAHLERTPGGTWVEVRIENPNPAVALVGAQIGRSPLLPGPAVRRGAGHTRDVHVDDQVIGTVAARGADSLWLYAEGDPRHQQLVAAVGVPERLRVHRIALRGAAVRIPSTP